MDLTIPLLDVLFNSVHTESVSLVHMTIKPKLHALHAASQESGIASFLLSVVSWQDLQAGQSIKTEYPKVMWS